MFRELSAKKIAAVSTNRVVGSRMNSGTSAQSFATFGMPTPEPAQESIFASGDDRQLLLALLLHCADIGNSVMPFHMAER